MEPRELQTVRDELIKAKRLVQPLWFATNTDAIRMFAADQIDLGYVSSFALQSVTNLAGAPKVHAITKVAPPSRFLGYVDGLCLARNAAHREAGLQLIEWLTSFRGRQILFERSLFPETDQAVVEWGLRNGFQEKLMARGVQDPTTVVPNMVLLAAPTDLQAWLDAFNEVRAA